MLAPARMCRYGVHACVHSCLCERDHEYLRLRASVCASARINACVCGCARTCVVCVRAGVCKRDRTLAPARMCECIRARMRSCVNVCRVIARVRVHARVFVRACRGMRM